MSISEFRADYVDYVVHVLTGLGIFRAFSSINGWSCANKCTVMDNLLTGRPLVNMGTLRARTGSIYYGYTS